MDKTELVAASAEEGASAVKDSAQVQEKEVVTATEAEAVAVVEQISIVAERDAKRTQECVFEPEAGLAVEEGPVGPFTNALTEERAAVASEAPGDPVMAISGETCELVGEAMGEAASVEEKEALMTAILEESSVELAELAPTMEIVEEVAVAPGEKAVEEQEFRVPPKHAVFLSHSGEQKDFVRRLSVTLQGCFLHPFFDLFEDSLPFGENFAVRIFDAIKECHAGVVVLSEKFFTSKWPMMELVAMVDRVKQTKGFFKILPVFYSVSTEDIAMNRKSWMSTWSELAQAKPRGVDIEKWADAVDYIPKAWDKLATQKPSAVQEVEMYAAALDYIRPINGLKHDRKNDLELENKIVDVLCQLVPPEIRLDDSHIEGRDRLCKVIQDKIVDLQKDKENGVCMVGLHGMHGFGKTSICKALCNKYNVKFRRRACHVELGRGSEEDLMREVLKKLTSMSQERLNGFKYDELCMVLREGIVKDAVFLAVDNMMNTDASIGQARHYLSARLPPGSIVMVTTHSKDSLMELRGLMDERNCLEMPELMEEEAKSLIIRSCCFNEVDEELLNHCIKLCNFKKGDDIGGCHYHPLALHVLGKQLECIDPKRWRAQLDKINEDIFNPKNEDSHPIFSILRRSFVTLSLDDQLLYMDVVLFVPEGDPKVVLEWLGYVHNISEVDNVLSRLQRLKTKSLLESLGDGVKTEIRMHDLWHKFCVAETKHGKLKHQRWVYETEIWSELVNTSPSLATCWGDVKRMAFLDLDVRSLEGVNFSYFPNVAVLKITGMKMTKKSVLDLSGLTRLKSLEISGSNLERLVVLGLPRGLHVLFLRSDHDFWKSVVVDEIENVQKFETETTIKYSFGHWKSMTTSPPIPLIKQISRLRDLKSLWLVGLGSGTLPDMRSMVSMRSLALLGCKNAVTLTGLSSRMTNLQKLDIRWCRKLRRCPGVGDLVNLEVLRCKGCYRLKRLPNLQKLRKLRILDIRRCPLITEVPGVGDLEALEKLYVGSMLMRSASDGASYSIKLPDMRKLSRLRVLRLWECSVMAVSGFEYLISLQKVQADFRHLVDKPCFRGLTQLRCLGILGWNSEGLVELNNLTLLRSLKIYYCAGVDKLPGLQYLRTLEALVIGFCQFTDWSSLSDLSSLAVKALWIGYCNNFKSMTDLQRLAGLEWLDIRGCPIESLTVGGEQLPRLKTLRLVKCESLERLMIHEPMNLLSELEVEHCTRLTTMPNLCNEYFPTLKKLSLNGCSKLATLRCSAALTALRLLDLSNCSGVDELPNLGLFPVLEGLRLKGCSKLTILPCGGALRALRVLILSNCSNVEELPDLGLFPALRGLFLKGCSKLATLRSSAALTALRLLNLDYCSGVKELPDLGLFPALEALWLEGCSKLTTLSSSGPLLALEVLDVRGCRGLSQDDTDRIQAFCPQCKIVFDAGVVKSWKWKATGCFKAQQATE